jgi:hypothetical protein
MFDTPILFLIFNRFEAASKSFSVICDIKPSKLYIAADGPREYINEDYYNCMRVRNMVLSKINWNCEVKTLFRENNLGCGLAVSSAISWFFSCVSEGIIIEDDCVPDLSFFPFCQELLLRYRDNSKIVHINGSNHQFGIRRGGSDYYFSHYPHVWGWATWKRAWDIYDFHMRDFSLIKKSKYFKKYAQVTLMNSVFVGEVDTWDIQWVYSVLKFKGLVITPNINLVTNIGFDISATHTIAKSQDFVKYSKNGSIAFPLKHPLLFLINRFADRFTAVYVHKIIKPNLIDRILKKSLTFKLKKKCF